MSELIENELYYIEYKDPNYPCNCNCHTDHSIIHFDACCSDFSYKKVARYWGFVEAKNCLIFTDPDPKWISVPYSPFNNLDPHMLYDIQKSDRKEYFIYLSEVSNFTVTVHRRDWDKMPKNRHSPKDFPIDLKGQK
jgi:hypothetical protein